MPCRWSLATTSARFSRARSPKAACAACAAGAAGAPAGAPGIAAPAWAGAPTGVASAAVTAQPSQSTSMAANGRPPTSRRSAASARTVDLPDPNTPVMSAASGLAIRSVALQPLDRGDERGQPFLRIREEHAGLLIGVQLVVDAGVAATHRALDDDDRLGLVHVQDGHPGDRRAW